LGAKILNLFKAPIIVTEQVSTPSVVGRYVALVHYTVDLNYYLAKRHTPAGVGTVDTDVTPPRA
jgi:hypothetical protein